MPKRLTTVVIVAVIVPWFVSTCAGGSVTVAPEGLPIVTINTHGNGLTSRERVSVAVTVLDGSSTLTCRAELSIRGSSSAQYPKKPYRLELQDENGDDLKVSLLGMPKESDWILFPAYTDKTMIRDALAYELWRQMGYWAPRTRYVELYLVSGQSSVVSSSARDNPDKIGTGGGNGGASNVQRSTFNFQSREIGTQTLSTNDYEGVYVLVEKIKRGKDRVNIAKLTRGDNSEPKITGGYIFKRDKSNSPNDRVFRTKKRMEFIWEEPKGRDVTPEQESYITNFLNELETVLYGENFADPEHGYRKYIDVDAFIDYTWMQELGNNPDGYWSSEYYHKDRGGKLRIGPTWDMDLCFGGATYNDGQRTDGWRWAKSGRPNYNWYRRLFQDPDFLQRYIDRWSELRTNVFATSNVIALIDGYATQLKEAQKRNYERWPTLGKKIFPNWYVGQTYEEEVNWLKEWIKGRLEWIDTQDFPKSAFVVDSTLTGGSGVQSSTGQSIRMACLVGKIFYTTDGSDPRLSGGAVSERALEYKEPIAVTSELKLLARVRSDYGLWSAPVVVQRCFTEGREGREEVNVKRNA